jgi:hypothetical protein
MFIGFISFAVIANRLRRSENLIPRFDCMGTFMRHEVKSGLPASTSMDGAATACSLLWRHVQFGYCY